jgi:hypothetical protein
VAVAKPLDVMDDGGSAGFYATVIALDALMLNDGYVLEVIGFLSMTKSSTSLRSVP